MRAGIQPETNGTAGYLARWFDAELGLQPDLSPEVITGDEIARLNKMLATAIYATSLPRRLGAEATDEELALDTKRGKRTVWALAQSLRGWAGKVGNLTADDEIKRAGAQIEWMRFKEEHATHLNARLALVATWAIRAEQDRWGKSAVVKLSNELSWVGYALRE